MILASILFATCFSWLAYRHYYFAVGTLFALLPTYLIRFSIGPLPSTILELMILILIFFGAYRYRHTLLSVLSEIKDNPWMYYGIILFVTGATLSVLTSVELRAALGEWKAFYIEPILLILVLIAAGKKEPAVSRYICNGLLVSGIATMILVIYQGFTGDLIASGYQGRATGWYGYPNGVGLFLGMIWGIILYARKRSFISNLYAIPFLLLAPLALYFSRSTGAIIAILATIIIVFLSYRKMRYPTLIAGIIGLLLLLSVPSLSPIKQEVLLQDRSGQIRVHMWNEAMHLLKDRPMFGAGLASYEERIVSYHTTVHGEGIEIFHHPHNLFLTMWVNTGLIGLIGCILLIAWMLRTAIATKRPYLFAAIGGVLVLGLVDSPYIKNDISIVFWTFVFFIYIELQNSKVNQTPSET